MSPLLLTLSVFVGALSVQLLLLRAWRRTPATASASASVFTATSAPPSVIRVLGRLATPSDPTQVHELERSLIQAGLRGTYALPFYLALRTALAIVFPAVGYGFVHSLNTPLTVTVLLSLATAGYLLPVWVVRALTDARRTRIKRVFPNGLDMLVNCLEGGLGIDAALRYTARELAPVGPELAAELDGLNAELQSGLPRGEALTRMRDRVGVDDIDGLVSVVAQSDRFGVGIAESMRAHAKMSRRRRILDAERRAAEAAPKLTVAMVLFILPTLFIVLIGPTAIRLTTEVIPMLGRR